MIVVEQIQSTGKYSIERMKKEDKYVIVKKFSDQLGENEKREFKAYQIFKKQPAEFVVKIYQVTQNTVQMEWCSSKDLKAELQRDQCAEYRAENCIIYMLSILYALTQSHKRGIKMHRDIKPENIFITHQLTQKKLKLGDFGTCLFQKKSKAFEAPEVYFRNTEDISQQFDKEYGQYCENCDIWSLGVICYQIYMGPLIQKKGLTGYLNFPFIRDIQKKLKQASSYKKDELIGQFYKRCTGVNQNKTEMEMLDFINIKNQSKEDSARLAIFKQLVLRMLEINPKKRPSSLQLYKLISDRRTILFNQLQHHRIINLFDHYYEMEKQVD